MNAKKLTIKEIAVFGMLAALIFASKKLMEFLPNIHLVGVITVAITLVYRRKALYPLYAYIFLDGLFGGFATWWLPYLYIWTVLWGAVMLLPRRLPEKWKPLIFSTVCGLHGLLFGVLYAPVQALVFGLSLRATVAWVLAGLPFDAIHAASNFICGFLIVPIARVLQKLGGGNMGNYQTASAQGLPVLLVRHGRTRANFERRFQGGIDEPLSPEGIAEAKVRTPDPTVKRVFVSPLSRARDTASILFPNAEQTVIDNLREMSFGIFEGRCIADFEETEEFKNWLFSDGDEPPEGAEKRTDFCNRAAQGFLEAVEIAKKEGLDRIVVVSHGGTGMGILTNLARNPSGGYFDWEMRNLCGWQGVFTDEGFIENATRWPEGSEASVWNKKRNGV